MKANPDESGDIIAKVYNIEPAVARSAVRNLLASRTNGVEYWGAGEMHMDGLRRAIELQKMVGAITGDVDAGQAHRHQLPARRSQGREVSPAAPPQVSLRQVEKIFAPPGGKGEPVKAIGPLDLELHHGEFFAVVGPSGCGKTTLLELVAGPVGRHPPAMSSSKESRSPAGSCPALA